MKRIIYIVFLLVFASCNPGKKKEKEQITIFCAASLTDVIMELKELYQKQNAVDIKLNMASTGTLVRQIEQGAPADIFISANQNWMDYLFSVGLIEDSSVVRCAQNSLVVIVPIQSPIDTIEFNGTKHFPGLFKGRLSIGDPDYVPVGSYAIEAINNLNLFSMLEDRFLRSKDARSALMVVELAEVEAGIVYKTDALSSEKVKIVGEIPKAVHSTINYYGAIINGKENQVNTKFHTFIHSKETKQIWEKYGFNP